MTIIYHIAEAADWEQAQRDGQYTMSSRGRTLAEEGFIHASTAEQVPLVAGEPDPYPHIYGPLNLDAVIETRPFQASASAPPAPGA